MAENIKTHIWSSIQVFRKSCRLWCNAEKHDTARKARNDNIIGCRKDAVCMPGN